MSRLPFCFAVATILYSGFYATAALAVIDPYNLTSSGNVVVGPDQSAGQSFTMNLTGQITGIEIAPLRDTGANGTVFIEVFKGAQSLGVASISTAGFPVGGGAVPAALSLNAKGPGFFDLANFGIYASQSDLFSFTLTKPSGGDTRAGASANTYSGGISFLNGDPLSSLDLAFKIFVVVECDARRQILQSLVGWWRGEGNANDAIASNHGTPQNGSTFVGGQVGQCFRLDGVDDRIANLGTASSFSFVQNTGVFTIEAWIGLDDPVSLREQTIAANIFSSADKGFYFGVVNSGGQHGLQMALGRGGALVIDSRSPDGLITTPTWHHVAAVGDGSHVTFYVDGVAYTGSGTMTTLSSGASTRAVDLGWDNVGSYFGGQLDEVAIYDRALTASEIQRTYAAGPGGLCAVAGVEDIPRSAREFHLDSPWPNPTQGGSSIRFFLAAPAHVRMGVFDVAGRRLASPIEGARLTAGEHRTTWDGNDASGRRVTPGIYHVRIAIGAVVAVRKIVMIE